MIYSRNVTMGMIKNNTYVKESYKQKEREMAPLSVYLFQKRFKKNFVGG